MGKGVCKEAHEKYDIPDCKVCSEEIRDKVDNCYYKEKGYDSWKLDKIGLFVILLDKDDNEIRKILIDDLLAVYIKSEKEGDNFEALVKSIEE